MTRWFPIAPGTTVPAAPAPVGGQITATRTVPVWNETLLLSGKTSTKVVIGSYDYALAFTTEATLKTKTKAVVTSTLTGPSMPASDALFDFEGANGSTSATSPNDVAATFLGTAAISTTEKKFGNSSAYFDGSNSQIDFDTGVAITTQDFTVEFFIYIPSGSTKTFAVSFSYGVDGLNLDTNLKYNDYSYLYVGLNGSIDVDGLTLNAWHHIAIVRESLMVRIAVDGVWSRSGGTVVEAELPSQNSSYFALGAYGGYQSRDFRGYIDEFYLRVGQVIYDKNDFTPPSAPF